MPPGPAGRIISPCQIHIPNAEDWSMAVEKDRLQEILAAVISILTYSLKRC